MNENEWMNVSMDGWISMSFLNTFIGNLNVLKVRQKWQKREQIHNSQYFEHGYDLFYYFTALTNLTI